MKLRLDTRLTNAGYVGNSKAAFVLVTEGRVFVNGQKAVSPGQMVGEDDEVEVRGGKEFVGRGAYKLEAAIEKFGVDVRMKVCADVGAATGGFSEVLLKHGAKKVYAIDVGRGKLDIKLREDPRVAVREGVNVLNLGKSDFHNFHNIDIVAVDLSFTSLRLVLPIVQRWLSKGGRVVALFKPQYEIADKSLLKHGIVHDEAARQRAVEYFRTWLRANGWSEFGFMESPIRGSEGNIEYLFYLKPD